ncbi:MAG TPA: amylo-alpha-1,6-glucosidase, partial [Burkholderiaceae bacterium]|nr:amylo-alpha-1,6-glucosidase [Burkholderiaceae bacterium]
TAFREHESARQAMHRHICAIETSNPLMNRWLCRSVADLVMLTTRLPTGPYPYAGVPWYATTFGRDGLLTAWMSLWAAPELTRGVLAFLAETQAHEEDPANDAEPGKILHEARKCETARTGEVPFGRYYGTVDATPLFIGLAGAYLERSGDLQFVRRLWPHIERALEWIDRYGDADGDGFVEYRRRSEHGLVQQGWKDSHDSIFHADGRHAEAPIALCEVQGYVYQAKRAAARMAGALGDARRAEALDAQAETLRTRFQQAFWCEDLGLYALALDGDKRPCRVATSNAGHALWSGIAHPQHAARIAQRLLEPDFHSGWGIRTLAEGQPHYNPMSYHNGSVWPHDNALIALGMARYGHTQAATQVLTSLFEASLHFENHRLPELFCGFPRRPLEGPTLYPVACSPQAWASAAVFALVQACLGLDLQAATEEISFATPQLPPFIDWMRITDLAVQGRRAELLLKRYDHNVGIELGRKEGGLRVRVTI